MLTGLKVTNNAKLPPTNENNKSVQRCLSWNLLQKQNFLVSTRKG